MRATLIHNPKSGTAEDEKALKKAFKEIGWELERTASKQDLERGLEDLGDAVVIAGGDGTVGAVAGMIAARNVPMVVVPTGTANNFARSLGIGVDPLTLIAGLATPAERRIDLGSVRSSEGDETFIECVGLGLFAYVVGEHATEKHKKLGRALDLVADRLEKYEPQRFELELDGRDLSGEYLLAVVMNTRSFGPVLGFAPRARLDDGELDVVLVRPEARGMLLAHLRRAVAKGDAVMPEFEMHRGQSVTVRADGRWAHVDDDARGLEGPMELGIQKGALRVLVPAMLVAA